MAGYTIIRSNGNTLTTIQDGTINTVSTSLSLPGRNYAGYGQAINTNFVRITENFAADVPPANPIKGQLWFNTTLNTLNVCPSDNQTNALAWLTLTSVNSGGSTTLGNVTVTGNIIAGNAAVTSTFSTDTLSTRLATISDTISACTASFTSGTIASLTTQTITTGAPGTAGTLTGSWTVIGNASSGGTALSVQSGNISFTAQSTNGVKCDNYMYANGSPFNPSGTYTNANVSNYLTGTNGQSQFVGNIAPYKVTTSHLAGGGDISGVWTLTTGARIQATYADLAERFHADAEYDVGTVVQIGGTAEVTKVVDELSDNVFGVVSKTAAYLMNGPAGTDETHPQIALAGRVTVKTIGKVTKGQRLVSAGNGVARAAQSGEATMFNTIGRALENKNIETEELLLAVVVIK
jgi:hypothetical protein